MPIDHHRPSTQSNSSKQLVDIESSTYHEAGQPASSLIDYLAAQGWAHRAPCPSPSPDPARTPNAGKGGGERFNVYADRSPE